MTNSSGYDVIIINEQPVVVQLFIYSSSFSDYIPINIWLRAVGFSQSSNARRVSLGKVNTVLFEFKTNYYLIFRFEREVFLGGESERTS